MSTANTVKESTHLIFAPNDDYGICDHCTSHVESRYDFQVNATRTEKRCAKCVAKGVSASYVTLDEVAK